MDRIFFQYLFLEKPKRLMEVFMKKICKEQEGGRAFFIAGVALTIMWIGILALWVVSKAHF